MDRLSPLRIRGIRSRSRSISPQPDQPSYQYQSLLNEGYTRIVRLLPGTKEQHLECQLINVPIEGNPIDYETVSYTWGKQDQSQSVSCDGREIAITKDLHTVIRYLRRPDKPRDLWIDQLSIDQEDVTERSCQVQRMADIYKNSTRVLIWIGEETRNDNLAFKYAKQLVQARNTLGVRGFDDNDLSKHKLPKTRDNEWRALGKLVQRPWFSRAWVTQEVAVSKDGIILCGNLSMPWHDFAMAITSLTSSASRYFGANLYHNGSPAERIGIVESWRMSRDKTKADAFKVFTFTKNCDATDDRDKLFAFTALSNLRIKADYLLTTEEVYMQFGRDFVQRALKGYPSTRSFSEGRQDPRTIISGFLCNAGKLAQKYDLPSWIPDWSVRQTSRPLWTTKTCPDHKILYNAGGDTLGDCDLQSYSLTITVYLIDRIARVGTVDLMSVRDLSGKELQSRCLQWFNEAAAMCFSSQWPYITGENRNEALMRTLIADVYQNNRRATIQEAHAAFHHFLTYIYQRTTKVLFSPSQTDMLAERFAFQVLATILGRIPFVTEQGWMGLAPYGAKSGDEVAIMVGGDVPFLLRRIGHGLNGPEFHLLGECYLHGMMFGEALGMGLHLTNAVLR